MNVKNVVKGDCYDAHQKMEKFTYDIGNRRSGIYKLLLYAAFGGSLCVCLSFFQNDTSSGAMGPSENTY